MRIFKQAITLLVLLCCFTTAVYAGQSANIKEKWAVNVDQRLPNAPVALSAPAIVHHQGETWAVLGGRDGWVHVYDMNGNDVRRFPLDGKSDSGAAVLPNGLVVLGDINGYLYAVNPVDGLLAWKVRLTSAFTGTPVLVTGGFLVQTTDGRIYRFSDQGDKLWSFSGSETVLSMYVGSSPLVAGDTVYAVLASGDAVALKLDSGDVLWKRQLLLSNDSATLSELKVPTASPVLLQNLAMAGEKTKDVLLVPFFQGDLTAVSSKDGSQYFSLPLSLKTSPVVLDGVLYAADSSGFLEAHDIVSGNRTWRKKVSSQELIGPVSWSGMLWLADQGGKLYCLNTHGDVQGSLALDGNVTRLPVVTDAGLLVRTDRGSMHMVSQ